MFLHLLENLPALEKLDELLVASDTAILAAIRSLEKCSASGGDVDAPAPSSPEAGCAPLAESLEYFCGECGDTGRVPNEGPLRWADVRFDEDDSLECTECPRCPECLVEWREHGPHVECP